MKRVLIIALLLNACSSLSEDFQGNVSDPTIISQVSETETLTVDNELLEFGIIAVVTLIALALTVGPGRLVEPFWAF